MLPLYMRTMLTISVRCANYLGVICHTLFLGLKFHYEEVNYANCSKMAIDNRRGIAYKGRSISILQYTQSFRTANPVSLYVSMSGCWPYSADNIK